MSDIHPMLTTFHRGAKGENLRSGYITAWAFCAKEFLSTSISHEANCDFRSYGTNTEVHSTGEEIGFIGFFI